jgi:uncharacterized RDD family membrane protein YckC
MSHPLATPPQLPPPVEYVGFWLRVLASLLDSLALLVLLAPIGLIAILNPGGPMGQVLLFSQAGQVVLGDILLPALVIFLWLKLRATPGKMVLGAVIVDADTGAPITLKQGILRYLGYFVSALPFCLGLLWVAFDARKQGWHDKIARTVVVKARSVNPMP